MPQDARDKLIEAAQAQAKVISAEVELKDSAELAAEEAAAEREAKR